MEKPEREKKELLVYHGDLIRWPMDEQPLSLLLPLSSLFLCPTVQFRDEESLNLRGISTLER